jgi:hypothetical protein
VLWRRQRHHVETADSSVSAFLSIWVKDALAPFFDHGATDLRAPARREGPAKVAVGARGGGRTSPFSTANQPEATFVLGVTVSVIPFPTNQFLRSTDDLAASGRQALPMLAGPNTARCSSPRWTFAGTCERCSGTSSTRRSVVSAQERSPELNLQPVAGISTR